MKIKLTSIYVDDQDKALRFYTDVLGLVKKADFSQGPFRWLTVASAEEPDGTELQLAANDNPAARTYQQALFEQGQPARVGSFSRPSLCRGNPGTIEWVRRARRKIVEGRPRGDSRAALFRTLVLNLLSKSNTRGGSSVGRAQLSKDWQGSVSVRSGRGFEFTFSTSVRLISARAQRFPTRIVQRLSKIGHLGTSRPRRALTARGS